MNNVSAVRLGEAEPVLAGALAPLISSSKPLRVLHVHAGNIYGGIESMLLTYVRQGALCPEMQNSFALCFAGRFSVELESHGAVVHQLGQVRVRQPLSVRRARNKLLGILRSGTFDVVVTHSSWSQAIFGRTVRLANVPLVLYLHAPLNGRHWLERLAQRNLPDLVLCNSAFTAASVERHYPQAPRAVLHCAVSPPANESRQDAHELRAALDTSDEATVIVQVSRMEAWKGHSLHFEALSRLLDLPNWVCWIVGGTQQPSEEKYFAELRGMASRLKIASRIRFLGERADVTRLLAAADIYCQPNTGAEPFGLSFIEALHARLPIVTTALGGALEIADESCSLIASPGDVSGLEAKLRELIQNPLLRTRLGEAGPARARALCDPHARLGEFCAALSGVVHVTRS
jgi:glycosyltransferase involved in cell wall biosynthesis